MAVCVGCGLEVNNGILEVNVCGDPVIPNTATGGLQCDPASEGGCLKVVLNDSHAGCGLNAVQGHLEVDPCTNGGILCGPTADDADQCIYINVQGQGAGACIPLATAQATCPSPACNGLVRTCEGLWAPPKLFGSGYGALGQDGGAGSIDQYTIDPGNLIDVPLTLADGFSGPNNDFIVTSDPNFELFFHETEFRGAACPIIFFGNTFSTFSISYFVKAGELWRWNLWERACSIPGFSNNGTTAGSPCAGNGWILQASFYNDRRNLPEGFETVQMNDVSTHLEEVFDGPGTFNRWEYMITVQRLVGVGPLDNQIVGAATRQYRKTTATAHCSMRVHPFNTAIPA